MNTAKINTFYKTLRYYHRNKNCLGLWMEELNSDIKLKIEKHWSQDIFQVRPESDSNLLHYVLPMFPYPSGNLHMGHVRVYTISDTIGRFQKLNGFNVIHPMGWDAFGLPAENAAIERGIPPEEWTVTNIKAMKTQLTQLGFDFDWEREISTCDQSYYKWTQYIFLKLFERGLAYQCEALVNWDPVDKTVLADEQVDEFGHSWRSGALVEKKLLRQWFIRTTKFAKQLYDGLNSKALENWKDIINLQKHWIGECNGVSVHFSIFINNKMKSLDVWTSDPYKFIYGDFLIMQRSNVLIKELSDQDIRKVKVLNPITNAQMNIYVSDSVDYPEGRDVYIASPSTDTKDKQLATSLGIPYNKQDCHIDIEKENLRAIEIARDKDVGGYSVSSKLKDWLISRQRFWGTPIPIIHCANCGAVPVPFEELPVKLPKREISETNTSLSELQNWVNCECPKCQRDATRETDTMDTFVDSSWYYYRFLDVKNGSSPFDKRSLMNVTPVDIYIGGKEHAVLHLYYARFMSYFLNSLGWTPHEEPFKKLLVQGMVMGKTYKQKSSGKYIPAENVEKIGDNYVDKNTGEHIVVQWEKMSKSKHNGENPERLLNVYGCDTTRLLILADVPPVTSRHWSEETFPGVLNWQKRLWLTLREFLNHRNNFAAQNCKQTLSDDEFEKYENKIYESRNYYIATATFHFKYSQMLSVGISRLQALTSVLRNNLPAEIIANSKEFELALATLIIMLSPMAPHFSSELWAGIQSAPARICTSSPLIDWNEHVLRQKWPTVDPNYKLSFTCKVDGVDRCELKMKATELSELSEEKALNMMVNEAQVAKRIKRGISKVKYELYPDCRAIIHIFTNKKQATLKTVASN